VAHEGPPWARFPLATGGLEERERLRTPGHRWLLLGGRRTAQGETVKEPVDAGFTKSAEEPFMTGEVLSVDGGASLAHKRKKEIIPQTP